MNALLYSDTYYLTPSGLDKLKKERNDLLSERATKGREDEDEILEINRRLTELRSILQHCELIEAPLEDGRHVVGLGATVIVWHGNVEIEYVIVGTLETDLHSRRISNESPLGKALLGCAIGDTVVISPSKNKPYVIKDIRYEL